MIRRPLYVLLLIAVLLPLPLFAAEAVQGMSKQVYDGINKVQLLIDEESYTDALATLNELSKRKTSPYEAAYLKNMIGYMHFQLDQMPEAMQAYRDALSEEKLPDSMVRMLLTTVTQVSLASGDYASAEKFAQRLLASKADVPLQPEAYVLLAQSLIGQEKYTASLKPLLQAIAMQREEGKAPRENWLALLSSVYFNLEQYIAMRDVVYELVSLYPRQQYVMNLAALHGQLGDTNKQLALLETLKDDQRLHRSEHVLNLVNLLLVQNLPYKAAQQLEVAMSDGNIEVTQRNLELLSQAWYMAAEQSRAIPPLERAAAMADNGELYLRVSRLYMDIYQWDKAQAAATAALEKGGLIDTGGAWLLKGMALARSNELSRAERAFKKAAEYEDSEQWASQWLKFVDGEQKRMAALQ